MSCGGLSLSFRISAPAENTTRASRARFVSTASKVHFQLKHCWRFAVVSQRPAFGFGPPLRAASAGLGYAHEDTRVPESWVAAQRASRSRLSPSSPQDNCATANWVLPTLVVRLGSCDSTLPIKRLWIVLFKIDGIWN